MLVFWKRGFFNKKKSIIYFSIALLGFAQGLMGWYMVKSGFAQKAAVSQYRLMAHLALGAILFSCLVWQACDQIMKVRPYVDNQINALKPLLYSLVLLIFIMIMLGALVAGLRAGLIWNTFPLMGSSLFPPGLYGLSPSWLAAFEDATTVQFNHRMMAYLIFIIATSLVAKTLKLKRAIPQSIVMLVFGLYFSLCLQIFLGVLTLLWLVPTWLAALHQATAFIVFGGCMLLIKIIKKMNGR
jgi:heme a synthase